jgi:hypothetical protein
MLLETSLKLVLILYGTTIIIYPTTVFSITNNNRFIYLTFFLRYFVIITVKLLLFLFTQIRSI